MADKKPFSWEMLDALCRYKASLQDVAELLNVSEDTVQNRIKEAHGITFSVYRDKKLASTRMKLVETALARATQDNNATMLIFCLKNLCGWTDRLEMEADVTHRMSRSLTVLLKDCTDEELETKAVDISRTLKVIDEQFGASVTGTKRDTSEEGFE